MEITKKHLAKIKKGLKGLYNLSPVATEPYFSACSCECCGSELAGDRYEVTATIGKKHTNPRQPLLICVDCFLYLFT